MVKELMRTLGCLFVFKLLPIIYCGKLIGFSAGIAGTTLLSDISA
jgi:hypothetical protein